MPRDRLLEFLREMPAAGSNGAGQNETPGMDNSVVALKYPGLYLISTTDFFYPNVEDPLLQGRITACNVLSDLYANAVTEVDTVLMLLAVSTDMSPAQQSIVTAQIIRGFHETVREAGSSVTGGQTIFNASPLIGGVASSVRSERDFIRPDGCRPGDVLVLTKPLGTQVAVNLWQWRGSAKWDRVAHIASMELATAAYNAACESMSRLNLIPARLMHKYGAHGATDVTGFGFLGHARNLAEHQKDAVSLELHTMPIISGLAAIDAAIGNTYRLLQGLSAETSGGLLIALPPSAVDAFLSECLELSGRPAWVVGRVVPGDRTASIVAGGAAVIEV